MGEQARHTLGEVPIELGGKTYTLKATIDASDKVDAEFGGIAPAAQEVQRLNLRVMTRLVVIGIGTTSPGGVEHLRRACFEKGRMALLDPLAQYLKILANPYATDDGDEVEPDEGDPGNV